jgi:hypothetical protein
VLHFSVLGSWYMPVTRSALDAGTPANARQ